MKRFRLALGIVAFMALTIYLLPAQEQGLNWTRDSFHITTNGTYFIKGTADLDTLALNVSDAGTLWQIQVSTMESTAKVLYNWVSATDVGNYQPIVLPVGVRCTTGIKIVSSGTTPGTADVFITHRGGIYQSPTPTSTPTATSTPTSTNTPTATATATV